MFLPSLKSFILWCPVICCPFFMLLKSNEGRTSHVALRMRSGTRRLCQSTWLHFQLCSQFQLPASVLEAAVMAQGAAFLPFVWEPRLSSQL